MEPLKNYGFRNCLIDKANEGTKIIGICLGFQILADYSEEDGGVKGLGVLKSKVEKLKSSFSHTCWESFDFDKGQIDNFRTNRLTRKRKISGRVFYNHEYGFVNFESCYDQKIPGDLKKYSSMVIKDNIIGMQFHPEKSQTTGLNLLSMII